MADEKEEGQLGNIGLPNSGHTVFPDMRAITRKERDMRMPQAGQYPEPDALSQQAMLPAYNRTEGGGSEPTPLVGPGNTPNPSVDILGQRTIMPDPTPGPVVPNVPLGPGADGVPGNQVDTIGALGISVTPGSDVRPPLVPGLPSALEPSAPPDFPGFGSRS